LLYLPFTFWFLELGQNIFTKKMTGHYGWLYPESEYKFFYFQSLISWCVCVTVFWSLYFWLFIPKKFTFLQSMLVCTGVGWGSEWLFGFLADNVLHHPMQIWPRSPLVYVSFFALFWWFMNSVIFYFLTILVPTVVARLVEDTREYAGHSHRD
jgi:hypothetical protein